VAVAYVQSANVIPAAGAGTTCVKAFGSNVGAASLIVASTTWGGSTGGGTFADTANLAYTATVYTINDGGNACSLSTGHFANSAAGANTVTATVPLADNRGMIITEYSGVATSSEIDGTPVAHTQAGATSHTSNTVTVSQSGDLVYGYIVDDGNGAATITSASMTIHDGTAGQAPSISNSVAMAAGDKIGPASGTTSVNFVFSIGGACIISCICFKAASGAAFLAAANTRSKQPIFRASSY